MKLASFVADHVGDLAAWVYLLLTLTGAHLVHDWLHRLRPRPGRKPKTRPADYPEIDWDAPLGPQIRKLER